MGHFTSQYWENPYDSGVPRADRRSGEYQTYTPSALTGMRLAIGPEVDAEVAAAERAVRALNRGTYQDLGLVSRFLLRSEAIASSYIEGIAPSPRNVALAELALEEDVRGLSDTAQQVARNMTIVRDASDALSEKEVITVADLGALQASLIPAPTELQGVRATQNWIGGSRYHPLEAAHVPPPPDEVPALLEDLVRYMAGATHSPIIQAALAHAQFEMIHPFPDGNGRVGRALIHTVLTRRGLTAEAILPVSLVLATLHEEYIDGLDSFRVEGGPESPQIFAAIETWVSTFANAVRIAAEQAAGLERRLAELREEWSRIISEARRREGKVRATRRNSALSTILDSLPGTPVLTTSTVTRVHGVTTTAAQNALAQLTEYGILEAISIGRAQRAYMSLDVLDLLTRSERAMASRDFDTASSPPMRPVPVPRVR
ncbi:Fic family protein [Brachybacterium sp. AOP29-B2-41]|uniref:Fic family protein n=1 Tax=Brachybacterium sp. AOP29-B2-41 TaxID=3457704 RepID=UPI004034AEF4